MKSLLRRSNNNGPQEIAEPEPDNEHVFQFLDLMVNDYTKKVTRAGDDYLVKPF
ncbi:hypothetical protein [Chryseobacterium sp. CH1]|uniref:hypothetical protein n=1 Tax=Chryseobacterium sp. CH1 TaxID=713551 RepID=UPI001E3F034C|nr:hypothetical protein [Chryseobacterium sp. CH1]